MSHEFIEEVAIDTQTLLVQKAKRAARAEYFYSLTERDLERVAPLGDAALAAYAAIRAAAWGPRQSQWVAIPARTVDALGRGYRWWHSATERLRKAGLVEVERHKGRQPRYRLLGAPLGPRLGQGLTPPRFSAGPRRSWPPAA